MGIATERRRVFAPEPIAGRPHRSLWLRDVLPDPPDAPALSGADRADIAIIGGGFVGLWTAIRIKEADPACDVAVLERDICGGGASGRNGGMVLSWWPKLASLVKLCGTDEALRLGHASQAAITEIETFCAANGIDAQFRRGGLLWTATSQSQLGAWDGVVQVCEKLGVDAFRRLSAEETRRRAGSPAHLAGVLEPSAATVHPGALVRGLRRVAQQAGVRLFENSPVRSFTRVAPLELRTDHGTLRAEKVIVASNAWSAGLPELARSLIVVSSDIVATVPAPDRLAKLGWTGGEGITDSQMMVDYYRTTRDGRIVFGKGTARLARAGMVGTAYDYDRERAEMTAAEFRRYYPTVADWEIECAWGGPIDRTPESVPILGHLGGRRNILYGVGWSGNGVGPSVVGGRILASLALELDNEWSNLALVDRPHKLFPPEPVRYLGGQLVRRAVMRKERAERVGHSPRRVDKWLATLAPAGLEDKG